jgi:hypothetical protein
MGRDMKEHYTMTGKQTTRKKRTPASLVALKDHYGGNALEAVGTHLAHQLAKLMITQCKI